MAEFGFGFGGESVGQEFLAEFDVKARMGAGIGVHKTLFGPASDLHGHLAESVFLVVVLDALDGDFRSRGAGCDDTAADGWRERVEEHFGFDVARAAIEGGVQFAGRGGAIARLVESDCEVEVIVGVAGVVLDGALEIVGGLFLAAAGGDDSQVVIDLGEGQARGYELEGGFGFCEVAVSVGGETEIEIGLAGDGGGTGNLAEGGDRRFVRVLVVVGLAQFHPGSRVSGIEAGGFAVAPNFFFSGRRQQAANEVLLGVEAQGNDAGDVLLLGHGEVTANRVQQIPGESGLQGAEIGEGSGLVAGGQEFLRPHVEQLGGGGEAGAVVAIGAEHGVVEIHLLGEAVEGGTRRMNAGGETLAIVGAEALVAAGDVEDRRIQLLVEGFGEGFADPFETGRRRVVFEGDHDQGSSGGNWAGRGGILGAERRAEEEAPDHDENSGAFHGNSIISAGGRHHYQRRGGGAVRSNLLPLRTRRDTKERPKILVEDSAGFGGQAPHTLLLHTVLVHTSITPAQPSSSVQRFLVPSVRDLIFIFLFWSLLAGPLSNRPLADPDIGWHIRTGEGILATHSLPRTDAYSSLMQGQPWFAWEWLYDIALGVLHRACGLNGVVWLCALLVAAVLTLLLSQLLRRGTGLPLAIALLLLAEGAAMIHVYARPHIVSWLFSLLWFVALEWWEQWPRIADRCSSVAVGGAASDQRSLTRWIPWLFPVSMVLWVNLHGGWIFGLALLGIYAFAAFVESVRARDGFVAVRAARRGRVMAAAWVASAAATLANPYGWRLHEHIYRYLSDRYLMDQIEEFRSPDFHGWAERCFAVILLLVVVALAGNRRSGDRGSGDRASAGRHRLGLSQLLVMLLAVYAGLYASRNLPVSAMLLVLIAGPILWDNFAALADREGAWHWVRKGAARIVDFSDRMGAQEMQLRWHLWPVVSVALAFAICLHGGWLGSRQLIDAQFDAKKVPVAAVNFLQTEFAGKAGTDPVFSTDSWGGYVIYRMYPERKVVVDDRHDLYGSERIQRYIILTRVEPGWQGVLTDWQVRTALLPADSTLANLLRELPRDWRVAYEDKVAVVVERR